jgi:ParB/RepB/Spo0J family partition protein
MAASTTPAVAGEVLLDLVVPDPGNPRPQPADAGIGELAESIRVHGLEQPIVLTAHPNAAARGATPFMILHGERRYRAFRLLGRSSIPAVLHPRALKPAERLIAQLAENDNDHRYGLSLLVRARTYLNAYELSGSPDQATFAASLGKTKSWLAHMFWIARAEGIVLELLDDSLVTRVSTARAFSRLPPELQQRLLARARKAGHPVTDLQIAEAFRLVPAPVEPPAAERSGGRTAARADAAAPPAPRRTSSSSSEPAAGAIEIALTAEDLRFLLGRLGAETTGTLEELADRLSALLTSIPADSIPTDSIPAAETTGAAR